MQQTILALGALMIISMTSMNQQRSTMIALEKTYIREHENAAQDYVKKQLEFLTTQIAFDESLVGNTDDVDISKLTSSAALGTDVNEKLSTDFDDLDDFHGATLQIEHGLSADTFRFNVSYNVRYINPASPTQTSATATLAKEITISAVSRDTIGVLVPQYSASKIVVAVNNE